MTSFLVFLALLGSILTACTFPAWRDQVIRDLLEGRRGGNVSDVGTGSRGSQTVEFYDASGRHVGYGLISGGTVNVYGPDGSRVGYGRGR